MAYSIGGVAFSLFSFVVALGCLSATDSLVQRGIESKRQHLLAFGLALLSTVLLTELGLFRHIVGLSSLTAVQWITVIGWALAVLLVDEVIKVVLRRGRSTAAANAPAMCAPRAWQSQPTQTTSPTTAHRLSLIAPCRTVGVDARLIGAVRAPA